MQGIDLDRGLMFVFPPSLICCPYVDLFQSDIATSSPPARPRNDIFTRSRFPSPRRSPASSPLNRRCSRETRSTKTATTPFLSPRLEASTCSATRDRECLG